MKQLITLTGKETKKDLIALLVLNGAQFEGQDRADIMYYRRDSKPELLLHIKVFNANVSRGGKGNISTFRNDEAYSHKEDVDGEVRGFFLSIGIDEDYIKTHIPQKDGLKLMEQWEGYIKMEHNGFIGHDSEEKAKADQKELEFFETYLNLYK